MPGRFASVVAVFIALSGARAEPETWVGEEVMPKKSSIQCSTRYGDERQRFELGSPVVPVAEEKFGWLRIRDVNANSRDGWVKKADFVRVQDAPLFFTEYVKAKPNDIFGWVSRAVAWELNGELDNAIKDYHEAIKRSPKDATLYNNRGNVWASKDEYDRAIHDYGEAIRLEPKDPILYCNRGVCWLAKKDYDRAIKDFDGARNADPKYAAAILHKAYIFACCPDDRFRDIEKAKDLMKMVVALRKDHPEQDETLGIIAAAQGNFEEAIRLQTRALKDRQYAQRHGEVAKERIQTYEQKKPWLD